MQQLLCESLTAIHDWFNKDRLSLSLKKTFFTIFGTKQRVDKCKDIQITVNNISIDRKEVAKYLGVQLDESLTFHAHVNYLMSKTLGKLKLLSKIRPIMDQATALTLYQSLIVPICDYRDVIHDCISQKDSRTLQRLQNMGLKSILQVGKLTSTELIHSILKVLPLSTRRDMHMANEMAKVKLGLAPINVCNMFQVIENLGPVTRRQAKGAYKIPKPHLEMSKRNLRVRGVAIWDALPDLVTGQTCLKSFKQANKAYWTGLYPNGIT